MYYTTKLSIYLTIILISESFANLSVEKISINIPDNEFYISLNTANFYEAYAHCRSLNGYIFYPKDNNELTQFNEIINSNKKLKQAEGNFNYYNHWVGLVPSVKNGNSFSPPYNLPQTYVPNWNYNEPKTKCDEMLEPCVQTESYYNNRWNDVPCDKDNYFICKVPIDHCKLCHKQN